LFFGVGHWSVADIEREGERMVGFGF